jgi:hypothetical protein
MHSGFPLLAGITVGLREEHGRAEIFAPDIFKRVGGILCGGCGDVGTVFPVDGKVSGFQTQWSPIFTTVSGCQPGSGCTAGGYSLTAVGSLPIGIGFGHYASGGASA